MAREYPQQPVVGIGGVVIENGRALLIRRGTEPLRGQWSIPGGTLALGESLQEGVARELLEETGLQVRVLDMIETFDRIFKDPDHISPPQPGPRFHYVIVDFLCQRISGEARPGSDVTAVVYATEDELEAFHLTEIALRVLRKAFALDRARRQSS